MFNIDEKYMFNREPRERYLGELPPCKPRYTMTEEVEHTAREMRNTIERLLRFEERVKTDMSDLGRQLTSDNVLFKDTLNSSWNLFLQEVKNEINMFEGNVDASVSLFKSDLESNYATLSEDCYAKVNSCLETVNKQVTELEQNYETAFTELKTTLMLEYQALSDSVTNQIEWNNGAMQEANRDFQQKLTTDLNMFQATMNTNYDTFVKSIGDSWHTFKETFEATTDYRLNEMESTIADNEAYMKTNLNATIQAMIGDMHASGEFAEIIEGEVFNDLEDKINAHGVTPEMFGAIGDGVTDDTTAFVVAMESAKNITITGTTGKTYKINDLTVTSATIKNCNFVGAGDNGIILGSGAHIEKCNFTGFKNAIVNGALNIVHSSLKENTFQYNENGIYLSMIDGYSVNNVLIGNNYFVKNGKNVDDMTASYTSNCGYGLYLEGNICNVIVTDNVFEYNSFAGIMLTSVTNTYRIGAQIQKNYFEGNKHSAIYLDFTHRIVHMISVSDNFFSVLSTNVFETNYIYVNNNLTSVYSIEDIKPIQCVSNYTDKKTHETVLNSDNVTGVEFMITPVQMNIGYIKIIYDAILNNDITVRRSSNGEVVGTFTNGLHEMIVDENAYFLINRILTSGESIKILYYGR